MAVQPIFTNPPPAPTGICSSSSLPPANFTDVICLLIKIVNSLMPVIVGLTFFIFLWGLAKFILSAGDEDKIREGKSLMFWGVIALFVMVSVWGIVAIVYKDFFGGNLAFPLLRTS